MTSTWVFGFLCDIHHAENLGTIIGLKPVGVRVWVSLDLHIESWDKCPKYFILISTAESTSLNSQLTEILQHTELANTRARECIVKIVAPDMACLDLSYQRYLCLSGQLFWGWSNSYGGITSFIVGRPLFSAEPSTPILLPSHQSTQPSTDINRRISSHHLGRLFIRML